MLFIRSTFFLAKKKENCIRNKKGICVNLNYDKRLKKMKIVKKIKIKLKGTKHFISICKLISVDKAYRAKYNYSKKKISEIYDGEADYIIKLIDQ